MASSSLPSFTLVLLLIAAVVSVNGEKQTHLHFYLHGQVFGPEATIVLVASAGTNKTLLDFGSITVSDILLTEGPEITSTPVGRAQGTNAQASMAAPPASMSVENFVFTGGAYNGSTVATMGRGPFVVGLSERSVVGGSGSFRMARGYVLANFLGFNTTTGQSLLEYDMYIITQD